MDWRETTLGEICDQVSGVIQTGPFGSQLHESDYSAEGIPVVMPKDIIEGRIDTKTVARVAPEHVERLSRHKLKPGDIVYGRRGDIGRQALIRREQDGWLCGTGCLRLSLGTKVIEPQFLHYYLRQDDVIGWVANQAIGATMPNLNTTILRSVPVHVPPLSAQRRIAGVLLAYDGLIENCQRRIRILEEMARAIYREWFVQFRFPGDEKVPRFASSLGHIPQGWVVKALGEVANITMGLSPKGDTYNDEGDGTPLVNGPVEFGERFTKQVKWTTSPTKLCRQGDLVVCVRGSTTGKYVKSDSVYCLGRGVCALSSKYQCFVDLLFANELPALLAQTSGSTFPSWTGPQLQSHPVLSPPPELLAHFEEIVQPMSAAVLGYSRKIENLRRTRDLLLPRLLSGQVSLDVSSVEDVAEPTAPAPPLSQTDLASEEPALRAAEEAPPWRAARAGRPGLRAKGAASYQPGATPQEPRPPRASAESATHSTPPTLADESPLQGSRRSSSNPGALP